MNIYWGMARSEVAFAYKSGAKVVSKLKEDGDGGWCEDEKPEFNWEEYEYSVIVGSYTPKMPTLDVCIPNQINGREKIIRVESCAGCPYGIGILREGKITTGIQCTKYRIDITEYCHNDTMSPDCPLDDEIKSVTIARYNALKDEKDRLYKAISIIEKTVRRDATKHIRAAIIEYFEALDNREHGGNAAHKAFRKIQLLLDMTWYKYQADLKDKEVGG